MFFGIVGLLVLSLFGLYYFNGLSGEVVRDLSEKEVHSKNYNSVTYANDDGSFTTEIYAGPDLFFYDGEDYVDVAELTTPELSKSIKILKEIPDDNVFDFGSFRLHKGVSASVEDDELVLRDANDKVMKTLARPYSFDASGDLIYNDYVLQGVDLAGKGEGYAVGGMEQGVVGGGGLSGGGEVGGDDGVSAGGMERTMRVLVEVDSDWLAGADYPVVVDPQTNLSAGYDGDLNYDGPLDTYTRDVSSTSITMGDDSVNSRIYVGFIDFDTSSISDTSTIDDVDLLVNVATSTGGTNCDVTNMSDEVVDYTDDASGNAALYDDIRNNNVDYLANNNFCTSTGEKRLDLGATADSTLENHLSANWFSVGMKTASTTLAEIYSSDDSTASNRPKLIVTYTSGGGEFTGTCSPPGSGSWQCNQTCNVNNQQYTIVSGDLEIYDACILNLTGTTNISFSAPNSNIYVYSGGEINLYDTAGFGKT